MRWRSLIPSEHQEQVAVMQWADSMQHKLPEVRLLFAIPNGGVRPKFKLFKKDGIVTFSPEAAKLKAEGVKAGVPDLFLPVARQEWHGLFIELKRIKNASLSLEQDEWIGKLTAQCYAVAVCRGSEDAINAISGYLMHSTWSPRRSNGSTARDRSGKRQNTSFPVCFAHSGTVTD